MLVAVHVSVPGLYLPPVFEVVEAIKSAPNDHFTAGPDCRMNVSDGGRVGRGWSLSRLSVLGLYLPPVLEAAMPPAPPQTIISLPVQTAV